MSDLFDKSDEIREVLEELDEDLSSDSDHESDVDSLVCEEFDRAVQLEIGYDENFVFENEMYNEDRKEITEEENNEVEGEEDGAPNERADEGEEIIIDLENNYVEGEEGEGINGRAEQGEEGDVENNNNTVEEGGNGEEDEGDGWREWTQDDVSFEKFDYVLNSGFQPPRGPMPQSELEFFQLFFTDNLITEIVNETNRFSKEKILKNTPLRRKSIWWSWKDITVDEMKAFLGMLINMGMNPKPELDDYFSTDYVDYYPFFKNIFSKERFQQIFWNLHVSPPHNGPVGGLMSRSNKVRRVVLYLDKRFRKFYVPEHKVSVDESTVGFKGRVLFKVYNKDKPTKWGIKIFVVSESKSGYICGLEPYLGKVTTDQMERQDLGVTSRIVLHMVRKLEDDYGSVEGLHVFTDRFYTNVDLACALHEKKVHITGTIMRNRKGLPPKVRPKRKKTSNNKKRPTRVVSTINLKKGQFKSFRKDNKLSLLVWKDTNDVIILTSLYADNTTQNIRRVKKGGVWEIVKKPTVVCKYNQSMGGVDLADHYISTYAFIRKSVKWWRKVFFWLLETAIVNAYILFNMNRQKKVRQRKFRKELIKQLVGQVRNVNKRRRPSDEVAEERLNGKLNLMYPMEDRKTKDCAVCSDRSGMGARKRTKFFCKTCEHQPGLCAGVCFEKFHTLKNFKI